jgi:LysM repeat protein
MKGKISRKILFIALMWVTCSPAFAVRFHYTIPDTIQSEAMMHPEDTCVGPEMIAKQNVYIPQDGELLQFSDLLSQFRMPVMGKVISKYGWRRGRMHTGTDLKLNLGDTIYAAFDGEVFRAQRYYGYGNLVIVKHLHALETYYGHLSAFLVKTGDTIRAGQAIGLGGRTGRATGTHLHFEVRENRVAYNPELVYDFANFKIREDICDKERMADLIINPKTGESISITSKGTSYVQEMGTSPVLDYVIKAGDSLWEIARKCNTSVAVLCELNNLTTNSILKIGRVLKVSSQPAPKQAVQPAVPAKQ